MATKVVKSNVLIMTLTGYIFKFLKIQHDRLNTIQPQLQYNFIYYN